ncbi:MAG: radical SAM protein [Candidatus Cloacimonetes bacterium]|nr:radical SAM protein [Candidatus Cloacimonadota bacterium]
MIILPIFIPHLGCPFQCIFCNQNTITNQKSSVIDSGEISKLIDGFCRKNSGKIKQIAFFGGTFTGLDKKEQLRLLNLVEPYLSENTSVRISTRPDFTNPEVLQFCKENGIRTIELGIQSFDDSVLKASRRGYSVDTAIRACQLISDSGFELGIQIMHGLPSFSRLSFEKTIKTTISLNPAFVRIYPLVVLRGTPLEIIYNQGNYNPLTIVQALDYSAHAVLSFEEAGITVIKIGLHSDVEIEKDSVVAGPYHPTFGELVRAEILLQRILQSFAPNKTLCISKQDESLFRGFDSAMLKKLKSKLGINELPVKFDIDLEKNIFRFSKATADKNW